MSGEHCLAPLQLADPDRHPWDEAADLVVFGFGGAGAAAAIQAAELGADVVAVDRFSGGGATAFSGGIIYAGGGTRVQREAQVADDPDNMHRYLAQEVGDVVDDATLRQYCALSAATIDWLTSLGVPFKDVPFPEKTGYPPDGYYLYYSNNEALPAMKKIAPPAMRGHRPVGIGMGDQYLFSALRAAAVRTGVRLMTHAPVTQLITDAPGRLIGVTVLDLDAGQRAAHQRCYNKVIPMRPFMNSVIERQRARAGKIEAAAAGTRHIRARLGVIFATGGFVVRDKRRIGIKETCCNPPAVRPALNS